MNATAIKIFVLDDFDAIGRWISKQKKERSPQVTVYCVNSKRYQTEKSIEDFFHAVLTEDIWRLACIDEKPTREQCVNIRGNSIYTSLLSLTKDITDGLFLINVNLKAALDSLRQHQEGVELLRFVRLTEQLGEARNLHVVLYSFENQVELLKRKPGNLVMLSEGVTLLRLPEGLNNLRDIAYLTALSSQKSVGMPFQVAFEKLQALPASLIRSIQTQWCCSLTHELGPGKPFATALRNAAEAIAFDGVATEAQRPALSRTWLEIHNHFRPLLIIMSNPGGVGLPLLIRELDDWVQRACGGCLDLVFEPNAGLNALDKIRNSLQQTEFGLL